MIQRADHTSPLDCRNCGGSAMLRPVDEDSPDLACIRCGLSASPQLPELRSALARAWGHVASLRLKLEGAGRSEQRHRGARRGSTA